jgi:hypothetical protein
MNQKIKASGGIRTDLELIYYPLGDYWYAINYKYNKAITQAKPVYEEETDSFPKNKKKKIKCWELPVGEDETLIFEDTPIGKDMPYDNPIDHDKASEWFSMKKTPDIDEIYFDIKKVLQRCYDFSDERDLDVAILFVLQSWFCDALQGVFYVDVRSQMGGGKTILLELMKGLSRHGVLANDMSFAVIPRMVDRYKCTLFFDEIDMINKHVIEDVFKILRTGYRKGQKYIRAKPKTFEPETFDCYGAKAFNYRSDIADDLKNRSLPINTSKSKDKTLPILNLYKEQFLRPIFFKIFCFYMNSLSRIIQVEKLFNETMKGMENEDLVNEVKEVNQLKVNDNTEYNRVSSMRNTFLSRISHFNRFSLTLLTSNRITQELNYQESLDYMNNLMEKLTGRSIELFALVMQLCSFIGLDIVNNFKELLEEKAEFEDHDEEDLKNILREVLVEQEVGAGIHGGMGCKFRYYRDIQSEFMKKVHEHYGFKPNTGSMKKFLRELGFVDKISKKVLKFGDNNTALCLIYTDNVRKNLGVGY